MRSVATVAVVGVVLLACSSGSTGGGSGAPSGAGAGAPCIDYTTCAPGLYCFVFSDAVEGRCETLPAECGTKPDCSCMRTPLDAKCGASGRCSAREDRAVYSCPATVRKKEGETCSVARGCEAGLFCRVSTVTRKGTCAKLPAACGARADCNCLGAEGCAGGDLRECSILLDDASLVCE